MTTPQDPNATANTGDRTADRCYDCGRPHPQWLAEYLLALWESDNASVTPELDARAVEFSKSEHPNCFL